MDAENGRQKCLHVIVDRTVQGCIVKANELGVDESEYKDIVPTNSCFILIYYR